MPSWRGAHLKHRDNFTFTLSHESKFNEKGKGTALAEDLKFQIIPK
jgi:hypothetical protein